MRGALASAILGLLLMAGPVYAHGARIYWEPEGDSIRVSASFDDGAPMDSAQVTVFSGADPAEPWLHGFTDASGTFAFLPDREESLDWDVQVRKAGHGDIVHISLLDQGSNQSGDRGLSTLQIVLMSLCVVWGFAGTAMFFASRRRKNS